MALATIADYYAARGEVMPDPVSPADEARIGSLLEDASDAVRGCLFYGRYPVDADGNATDAADIVAITRATARWAVYYDNNPTARSEAVRMYDSISAGSFSLSARSGSVSGSAGVDWRSGAAIRILRNAGLISGRVSTSRG